MVPGDRGRRRTCFLLHVFFVPFEICIVHMNRTLKLLIKLFIKTLIKEDIILSEISHRRTDTVISLI